MKAKTIFEKSLDLSKELGKSDINIAYSLFGLGSFQAKSHFSWFEKAFLIKLNIEYFCMTKFYNKEYK